MQDEGHQNRAEWLAEMAEHRKDPYWRLENAMASLVAYLNRWEERTALLEIADRGELERAYEEDRGAAGHAAALICAMQRDLDQLRNSLVDELGVYDDSYFAQDDHLASALSGGAK